MNFVLFFTASIHILETLHQELCSLIWNVMDSSRPRYPVASKTIEFMHDGNLTKLNQTFV